MKSETKTNESEAKPTAGRAAFIHSLKAQGIKKPEALAKTQASFKCGATLFSRIWDRAAQGSEEASKHLSKQIKRARKTPPAKKSSTPPPRKNQPATPMAAPESK